MQPPKLPILKDCTEERSQITAEPCHFLRRPTRREREKPAMLGFDFDLFSSRSSPQTRQN
jgi:hypothetical protein